MSPYRDVKPLDGPEHYCEQGENADLSVEEEDSHGYGSAISWIVLDEQTGRWWAFSHSNEYASPIAFCPYCGLKL